MHRTGAIVIAVVAIVAAGCSSEKSGQSSAASGDIAPAAIAPTEEGASSLPLAPTADPASPSPGSPEPGSVQGEAGVQEAPSPSRSPGGIIPGGGRGVTDTSVKIGFGTVDLDALNALSTAAFGSSQGASGSMRDQALAVIKEINATGGLGGRMIEPVFHEYPIQNAPTGDGRARGEQEMCAAFTEDAQVFLMVPVVSMDGVIMDCAREHDTPLVATSNGEEPFDTERFSEVGNWWYAPGWMTVNRRDRAYVAGIVRQGFLPPDAVIGLMTLDRPAVRRSTDRELKRALAAAGHALADEIVYPDPVESNWAAYVLRLKAAGVTHLLWSYSPYAGTPQTLFMAQSESQDFRPKHFLSTSESLEGIRITAPPAQLAGARAVGWSPIYDIGGDRVSSEPPINAGAERCRHATRDVEPGPATSYCDALFFLQAAFAKAPAMTTAGLLSGAEALSESVSIPGTFASRITPDRHDGAAMVRDVAFDSSCACWSYMGNPIAAVD